MKAKLTQTDISLSFLILSMLHASHFEVPGLFVWAEQQTGFEQELSVSGRCLMSSDDWLLAFAGLLTSEIRLQALAEELKSSDLERLDLAELTRLEVDPLVLAEELMLFEAELFVIAGQLALFADEQTVLPSTDDELFEVCSSDEDPLLFDGK